MSKACLSSQKNSTLGENHVLLSLFGQSDHPAEVATASGLHWFVRKMEAAGKQEKNWGSAQNPSPQPFSWLLPTSRLLRKVLTKWIEFSLRHQGRVWQPQKEQRKGGERLVKKELRCLESISLCLSPHQASVITPILQSKKARFGTPTWTLSLL